MIPTLVWTLPRPAKSRYKGAFPLYFEQNLVQLIDFHIDFRDKTMLFPEEARALAKLLTDAADAADAIDLPCVDECGHWSLCDCRAEEPNS